MLSAIKIIFFNDTCIERIFIIIEINNNSLLSNYFKFYISSIMKNIETSRNEDEVSFMRDSRENLSHIRGVI